MCDLLAMSNSTQEIVEKWKLLDLKDDKPVVKHVISSNTELSNSDKSESEKLPKKQHYFCPQHQAEKDKERLKKEEKKNNCDFI